MESIFTRKNQTDMGEIRRGFLLDDYETIRTCSTPDKYIIVFTSDRVRPSLFFVILVL